MVSKHKRINKQKIIVKTNKKKTITTLQQAVGLTITWGL